MSGYFLPILRLVLLLLIHINMLATASADNESQPGKPSVFSDFNAGSITGLDFPGSAGVKATMRFKFTNPHNNGLPIYGVGGRGVTYIWRAFPRQQDGYYTAFFWGNDDGQNNLNTFLWKSINGNSTREADTYYGIILIPDVQTGRCTIGRSL